jgi:outer membrane protein assembly factor BamB
LGHLYVGLGGWGGAIDYGTTPFLRALKWDNSLKDAWHRHHDPDGVYRYTVPKPPMYTTPKELVAGSAAVVNDLVFVPTNKPALYALDAAKGTLHWTAPGLPAGLPGTTETYIVGPAIHGKYVAVGCQAAVYIFALP